VCPCATVDVSPAPSQPGTVELVVVVVPVIVSEVHADTIGVSRRVTNPPAVVVKNSRRFSMTAPLLRGDRDASRTPDLRNNARAAELGTLAS
jgi:hypothetical protein